MTRRCSIHGALAPDEDCERCYDEAVVTCSSCGDRTARPEGWAPDDTDGTRVLLSCGDVVPLDLAVGVCPECAKGVVSSTGPMEHDTGHTPYGCSANCGYGG